MKEEKQELERMFYSVVYDFHASICFNNNTKNGVRFGSDSYCFMRCLDKSRHRSFLAYTSRRKRDLDSWIITIKNRSDRILIHNFVLFSLSKYKIKWRTEMIINLFSLARLLSIIIIIKTERKQINWSVSRMDTNRIPSFSCDKNKKYWMYSTHARSLGHHIFVCLNNCKCGRFIINNNQRQQANRAK